MRLLLQYCVGFGCLRLLLFFINFFFSYHVALVTGQSEKHWIGEDKGKPSECDFSHTQLFRCKCRVLSEGAPCQRSMLRGYKAVWNLRTRALTGETTFRRKQKKSERISNEAVLTQNSSEKKIIIFLGAFFVVAKKKNVCLCVCFCVIIPGSLMGFVCSSD